MITIKFDSERCLEDYMIEYEGRLGECVALGETFGSYIRQFTIDGYGIADIVGFDFEPKEANLIKDKLLITIFELKNEKFKMNHLSQLARYRSGIMKGLESSEFDVDVRGVLVFPKTFPDNTDSCFILDQIDWLEAVEFDFKVDSGLVFSHVSGWHYSKADFDLIHDTVMNAKYEMHNKIEEGIKKRREAVKCLESVQ